MKHPFTDTYGVMAVAAEEVQLQMEMIRREGNFMLVHKDHPAIEKKGPNLYDIAYLPAGGARILPRLDQLFEMLGWKSVWDMEDIFDNGDFDAAPRLRGVIDLRDDIHESLLRLWMFREHDKKWNGKAWVAA